MHDCIPPPPKMRKSKHSNVNYFLPKLVYCKKISFRSANNLNKNNILAKCSDLLSFFYGRIPFMIKMYHSMIYYQFATAGFAKKLHQKILIN